MRGSNCKYFLSLPLLFLFLAASLTPEIEANTAFVKGGSQKNVKTTVFSLFNLKGKSRFWSERILRGAFEDLESSGNANLGKMALTNYSRAGTVAAYLGLSQVEALYIPIPINFIFVGFEGKGNQGFKIGPEELEKWFIKIDHIFEHTRIPQLGEALTPFYRVKSDGVQRHHLPLVSSINYNLSVHAIEMNEKVSDVFERAIRVLSRPDNVSDNGNSKGQVWQINIDEMEWFFKSLIHYLEIDNAYNVFLLNPKREANRGTYGYRRGLSESETDFLKKESDMQQKLLKSDKMEHHNLVLEKITKPLYEKHPMSKFAWTSVESIDTENWVKSCLETLHAMEKSVADKSAMDTVYRQAELLLHGKSFDLASNLRKELKTGKMLGLHSECLVDAWISNERWAFIDLSAGPFSWGPSVGGEGVRTEVSLPSVEKTIGAVEEVSEEKAEDDLQKMIQEKFSVFSDEHHAVDVLLAEVDIYELFTFKHCKGRKVKLPLCEELEARLNDLKVELENFQKEEYEEIYRNKAAEALKRVEQWNLFSDSYVDSYNYTVARDSFLAHLGSTLWGSMRHIVAPSNAEGAYHYYEKVSFQLFFVTQEKVKSIDALPVDVGAIKQGISSLKLPSQKFQFSTHTLVLSEDPSLAMAFSIARRVSAVQSLLVNGTYRTDTRHYLDSLILQHQLQRFTGSQSANHFTLEVPVFWFIQHGDSLLIDKHYQAMALPDMVIVAQSSQADWQSHLQCNGQSLLWDLRNPLKPALAAIAEHLAGLVPLHLTYSRAHENAIQDWLWSVGCNPFAMTSSGWHTSLFQSDTIARSYIITSLEESIQLVNAAIERLIMERTNAMSYAAFRTHEQSLVTSYNTIVSLWRRIASAIGEMRYGDAIRVLSMLHDSSERFVVTTNSTIASLHPIHCTRQQNVEVQFDASTLLAFGIIVAVLWFLLRPRRAKAKIN